MKQDYTLDQEKFDSLLDWLSSDKEKAGDKYEIIRKRLINFFRFRGCENPDILADETINRVAFKLESLDTDNNHNTITYFYGFAKNVFREYLSEKSKIDIEAVSQISLIRSSTNDKNEAIFDCLEKCLANLPSDESDLILLYFSKNKSEKIELRRELADKLKMKKGTLHTKIHRLKLDLKKCLEKCALKENL